jgi:predicted nucleic acid-binding protein
MATTAASNPNVLADPDPIPLAPGETVFLDTNILVYASFTSLPLFGAARQCLTNLEDQDIQFAVSRQILREFLAAVTRPGSVEQLPPVRILAGMVREWEARCTVLEEDAGVTALLLEYVEKPGARGKQVHDANIIATMRRHAIPYLLTHNTSDFVRYAPWITVLPLVP